jgi:hypothetical protein
VTTTGSTIVLTKEKCNNMHKAYATNECLGEHRGAHGGNTKADFPRAVFSTAAAGSTATDSLFQMDVFPRAYAAALLSRSCAANAARRGDRRFHAAGSGGFMPCC